MYMVAVLVCYQNTAKLSGQLVNGAKCLFNPLSAEACVDQKLCFAV